jgi:predicted nuclease of restriction endonuclease-like (RecB) superfamily
MDQKPEIEAPAAAEYGRLLEDIKARIKTARARAALAVNQTLIGLYRGIGSEIREREREQGWGARVIDRLAADLRREFPDMSGLSRSNLKYMRRFAQAWPTDADGGAIGQQLVDQLPWGHNIVLLTKLDNRDARLWYAQQAIEHGWSRKVLEAQIITRLRDREGKAINSFTHALPAADSELVRDTIKDPYNFGFLALGSGAREHDLETALLHNVESFLMEMGRGFALVGRQWPLRIPDTEGGPEAEFFVDLLFFNYFLNRFVVIDLKVEDFKPEFAGKMNFYLTAVDELERQPGQEETIGLILCPGRNRTVTEWALRRTEAPMAVSRYVTEGVTLSEEAPEEMRHALPALPELAGELTKAVDAAARDASSQAAPTSHS